MKAPNVLNIDIVFLTRLVSIFFEASLDIKREDQLTRSNEGVNRRKRVVEELGKPASSTGMSLIDRVKAPAKVHVRED